MFDGRLLQVNHPGEEQPRRSHLVGLQTSAEGLAGHLRRKLIFIAHPSCRRAGVQPVCLRGLRAVHLRQQL